LSRLARAGGDQGRPQDDRLRRRDHDAVAGDRLGSERDIAGVGDCSGGGNGIGSAMVVLPATGRSDDGQQGEDSRTGMHGSIS